ncbi:MAG TPA: SIR2 family protein [Fimbriimonadaceae bacterium]|jgi:hypothetical protein
MPYIFPKWALLTGAGFTANWNAPTANDIWCQLLSNLSVKNHQDLVDALKSKDGLLFENVVASGQLGMFSREACGDLNVALRDIYNDIEDILYDVLEPVSFVDFDALVAQFAPRAPEQVGLVFTLNQDMLFERFRFVGHAEDAMKRPWVQKPIYEEGEVFGNNHFRRNSSKINEPVILESLESEPSGGFQNLDPGFYYVKLHGSWDWRRPGGHDAMVLGGGKLSTIQKSPLMKEYWCLFNSFLNSGNRRLMVIGYGFNDEHINRVLIDAVNNHGLKIHLWDIETHFSMRERLISGGLDAIWMGIEGYTVGALTKHLRPLGPTPWHTVSMEAEHELFRIFGDDTNLVWRNMPQYAFQK